jgi:hypothetical protein
MKRLFSGFLTVAGTLFVVLGLIGIFVPILPTTPFLLLAAACYARSSARFYRWLMNHPWFGESIRNYRAGRGIPLREKLLALLALWLTIGISALLVLSNPWVEGALLVIAAGVTVHLATLPTLRREPPARQAAGAIPTEEAGQAE